MPSKYMVIRRSLLKNGIPFAAEERHFGPKMLQYFKLFTSVITKLFTSFTSTGFV